MKRRVWSLLLAAALLLSLGVTALAEQPIETEMDFDFGGVPRRVGKERHDPKNVGSC